MEKEVGGAFLKQILTDKDEAFVISFDITVDLLQDFTRDIHRLQTALNKAKINVDYSSGGIPGMGGGPVPQHAIAGNAALRRRISFRPRHAGQRGWAQGHDSAHRRRG